MIEKYKDRLKEILSDEKVVKKRRSTKKRPTKRRSAKKRRSTKRRSTKRRSRFGANETLLERINKIAEDKNAEENDDEVEVPVTSILPRDSYRANMKKFVNNKVKNAEAEVMEAKEALAKAKEALAEAEAEVEEAPPPLPHPLRPPPPPPLQPPIAPKAAAEPVRRLSKRLSKWGIPGLRPEPPPQATVGFNKQVPAVGSSLSAARAAAGAERFQKGVLNLVKYINDYFGGKTTFGVLFDNYQLSDSLNGYLMSAKRQNLIEYIGGVEGMLQQGNRDKGVVITLTEEGKKMLQKQN